MFLHSDEKIVKIFRRFWLVYFWHWLAAFLFIVAPFFFMFLLFSWGRGGIILFAVSLSLGILFLARGLYFWRRNQLLVSTERILRTEQKGFLNQEVSELNLMDLENAIYQIKGFFPTLFRYGKIILKTGKEGSSFEFKAARFPARIAEVILNAARDRKEALPPAIPFIKARESLKNFSLEELRQLKAKIEERLKK
ncbi:MAG: hypothetical protein HY982_01265 [Candidatus Magasanikbacteria bacterium]|nr:hypothetical protein [Candidatus Magasanikbacteria bacterium]